jgi:glycosyltransferase involved in cell wall biosynthesis
MRPTVSVCIPTYNGATYLADCIESVLAQTDVDFELLIVDDCSSDDSVAIAHDYARRDPRVQVWVNDHNLGLGGNWNRSMFLSRGEWIKLVFQDDLISPECLRRMLAAATSAKVPIVSCARDFIFEAGTTEDTRQFYLNHQAQIRAAHGDSDHWSARRVAEAALRPIGVNLFGEPTAVFLHRSVFERVGWFSPHLTCACDLEYWIRVGSNTGTVHIPEVLATFRVHGGAMSAYLKQTAARRYCVEILDPLLITHDYAFHPVYSELRRVAASQRPPIDMSGEFWERARNAWRRAEVAESNRSNPDSSLREEWDKVARHYPRLARIPRGGRLVSKYRAVWSFMRTLVMGQKAT